MSKWVSLPVQLTANMVAGTDPVLSAESVAATCKRLCSIQSRSAGSVEFFFGALGAAGQGFPLAAGARWDFDMQPAFNGAIYIRGGTAAEYLVLLIA